MRQAGERCCSRRHRRTSMLRLALVVAVGPELRDAAFEAAEGWPQLGDLGARHLLEVCVSDSACRAEWQRLNQICPSHSSSFLASRSLFVSERGGKSVSSGARSLRSSKHEVGDGAGYHDALSPESGAGAGPGGMKTLVFEHSTLARSRKHTACACHTAIIGARPLW